MSTPQYAQICPYCTRYLLAAEEIEDYKGYETKYSGWIVHTECQKIYSVAVESEPKKSDTTKKETTSKTETVSEKETSASQK